MNPVLTALLSSWEWRADVILLLLLAATCYCRGWFLLKGLSSAKVRRDPVALASGWRLLSYLGGLALLALALLSPIDVLAGQLFYMHMIQHLLLTMFAPPLLVAANPLALLLWGVPRAVRKRLGLPLRRKSWFRRLVRSTTTPGLAWMIFITVFLGWHDPKAYDLALQSDVAHDIEHLTFFLSAMLFWWHAIGAGPRIHKPFRFGLRMSYLFITVPINMLAGIAITFAQQPIYAYYQSIPRWWGLTVLEDQMLGGLIMWIPGSMMYLIAALVLLARYFQDGAEKPTRAEPARNQRNPAVSAYLGT